MDIILRRHRVNGSVASTTLEFSSHLKRQFETFTIRAGDVYIAAEDDHRRSLRQILPRILCGEDVLEVAVTPYDMTILHPASVPGIVIAQHVLSCVKRYDRNTILVTEE